MIQRIQTVYLIIALLLAGCILFFPLIHFTDAGQFFYNLTSFHLIKQQKISTIQSSVYPIAVLAIISLVLIVVSILGFKNRQRQMKLCVFSFVLLILTFVSLGYYFIIIRNNLAAVVSQVNIVSYFPLLAAFFCYLGYKAIKRDDELVKSVDRLR
jgi:hypothetical protein